MDLNQAVLIFAAMVTVIGLGSLVAIYLSVRRLESSREGKRP